MGSFKQLHPRCSAPCGQSSALKFWTKAIHGSLPELPPSPKLLPLNRDSGHCRYLLLFDSHSPQHSRRSRSSPGMAKAEIHRSFSLLRKQNRGGSGRRAREMTGNERDCGKDLSSSQSCLVPWCLGQKSMTGQDLELEL